MRKFLLMAWVSVMAAFGFAGTASAYDVDIEALKANFASCVATGSADCAVIFTDVVAAIEAAGLPEEELTDALAEVAAAIVESAKDAEAAGLDAEVLAEVNATLSSAMDDVAEAAVDPAQKTNLQTVSTSIEEGEVDDVDEGALGSSPA